MGKLILNKKEYLHLRRRIEQEADLYKYKKALDDCEVKADGRVVIENPIPHLLKLLGPRERKLRETIYLKWNIADVKYVRPDLSRQECSEALRTVYNQHDPSIGVNWETLRLWARAIYPLTKSERVQVEKLKAVGWEGRLEFEQMNDIWKKSGMKVRVAPLQQPSGATGESK